MSKLVRIDSIDRSPWADLFPHDEEHVARLTEDIAERGIQTPLHVYPRGDRYELLSGHDRLEGAKRAGLTEVPCDVRSMLADEDERFAYFLKDNTLRKDVDKRSLVRVVLKKHADWSDRRVAAMCAVSPTTAGAVRSEMEAEGLVSSVDTRTGRDGVAQPARKPAPTGSTAGRRTGPTRLSAEGSADVEAEMAAPPADTPERREVFALAAAARPLVEKEMAERGDSVIRTMRRPVDARIRTLVDAAQAMRSVGDDDLRALETNDLMVEGLRVAVEQINRIITLHPNAGARHANA